MLRRSGLLRSLLVLALASAWGCSHATSAPAESGASAGAPPAATAAPPAHDEAATPPGHHHLPHRFQDAKAWAKVFDNPARDAWQKPDEVVKLLALSTGMTVVDLGAGTGYFMARLSRAVGPSGHVIETDIEPDMVRYMKQRAAHDHLTNVEVVQAPADSPGVAKASADRILVVDVWHHITNRAAYAAKLAQALRPGGAVYIVDFTKDSPHGPPVAYRLSPKGVMGELAAGGLETELLKESLPDQYIVVGRRKAP